MKSVDRPAIRALITSVKAIILTLLVCSMSSSGALAQSAPSISAAVTSYATTTLHFQVTPTTGTTMQSGNYALAQWVAGEGGGQALLQHTGGVWLVIRMDGGSMADAALLHTLGVPLTDASSLASQMLAAGG